MFLEDLFNWIQAFATQEGPQLITDGGKFAVQNTFSPVVGRLVGMLNDLLGSVAINAGLPRGFFTARVQRSLQQLADELKELASMAQPIRHDVTAEPDMALPTTISRLDPAIVTQTQLRNSKGQRLLVFGSGFNAPPNPIRISGSAGSAALNQTFFRSQGCLVAIVPPTVPAGTYDIIVSNPDGTSAVLPGGFSVV
jgi:hypothetical protein